MTRDGMMKVSMTRASDGTSPAPRSAGGRPSLFSHIFSVYTELSVHNSCSIAILPLVVLVSIALIIGRSMPAWACMWMLCAAVFFGCKWATYWLADARRTTTARRAIVYLFAWPGMNAGAFLDRMHRPARPAAHEWPKATTLAALGITLIFVIVRFVPSDRPLLAGWIGMVGLVLALHFGLFHVLSLLWRRAGVAAAPIMNAPLHATSLADFWGRRWNLGFHDLAMDLVFTPLRRRIGGRAALLAVFITSGLVHDLVISVPAGAGYGLPTLYFTLQGLGVLCERSDAARRIGLRRRGWAGRAVAATVVAAPLPLLFHPPFVREVIMPFLHAIGATGTWTLHIDLSHLLLLCGLLHFGILIASALVPNVLDWKCELATLSPLTRQLIWVHGAFIVLTIIAFGVISIACADALAGRTDLARAFCGFVALFWLARLGVQFFVFDATPLLTTPLLTIGYHGLTVVFTILTLCYGYTALAREVMS